MPDRLSYKKIKKPYLLIVVLLSGAVGAYAVINSMAATNDVTMDNGFESGNLQGWNTAGVGDVVPTVVSDIVRSGTKSARFTLTGNQSRTELILGGNGGGSTSGTVKFEEGKEYFYGFSTYVSSMVYGKPGNHALIMQLKSNTEGSPPFGLQLWDYAGDNGKSGGKGLWTEGSTGDRYLAPFSEREWHDIAIHFKVGAQNTGFFRVYLDGKLVDSKDNVSTLNTGAEYDYIKNGMYRNGSAYPGTTDLRIDNVKLGNSLEAVMGIPTTPPVDTTAPNVSITTPANSSTVSGTGVSLSASASDNVGVAGVQFKVNGSNVGVEDTSSPYTTTWNSTSVSNGAYTITAVARDAAGNTRTSSAVNIIVNNAVTPPPDTTLPAVSVTAPANNATVTGSSVSLSASATDNIGVTGVQFKVDGNNVGVEDAVSPYTAVWDSTRASNGIHTITAVARDAAGNTRTSTVVNVTVNNTSVPPPDTTPPTVSIASPSHNATVSGVISINATASDNTGVSKVEFSVDGSLKLTDNISPYAYTLDTKTLSNGNHTVSAKAFDAAGNVSAATITINVQNVDNTAPNAPANLSASAVSATTVNLSWNGSSDTGTNQTGVAKYNVLRKGPSDSSFVVIAQPTITGYVDSGRTADTAYSYQVQAIDGAGNVSANSNTATVRTPTAPDMTAPNTPSNVEATAISKTQVNITWNASTDSGGSGLSGYNVYRNGTKLNSSLITSTSYGDSTGSVNTTYSYRIEAVDGAGNKSGLSTAVSVTTLNTKRGDVSGPNGTSDGVIDLRDVSYVLRKYNTNDSAADVSGPNGTPDGVVDLRDISYVIRNYGN